MKRLIHICIILLWSVQMLDAQKIPVPNQNVKDAFSLAASIYNGHIGNVNFENRLQAIVEVDFTSSDPDALIREYKRRLKEIEREAERRARIKEQEVERKVALVKKGLDKALAASNVDLGFAGNLAKDLLVSGVEANRKRKAQLEIQSIRAQASRELEQELKTAMYGIYKRVEEENKQAMTSYMEASADVFNADVEEYYIKLYQYHGCIINYMERNYDYKSTDWLDANCSAPFNMHVSSSDLRIPQLNYDRHEKSEHVSAPSLSGNKDDALARLETLIENTSDINEKIELLELKQQLLKDQKQEESKPSDEGTKTNKYLQKFATSKTKDYADYQPLLEVAQRKFKLYQTTMPFPEFLESAKRFAEAELSHNNKNTEAYFFLASLTESVVEKMAMVGSAYYLDQENQKYIEEFEKIYSNYGKALFSAIEECDKEFVELSSQYNLISGFVYENETPLNYAIKQDVPALIPLLNVNEVSENTMLEKAFAWQSYHTAKSLLEKRDFTKHQTLNGRDLFMFSVESEAYAVSQFLLDQEYPVLDVIPYEKYSDAELFEQTCGVIAEWSILNDNYEKYQAVADDVSKQWEKKYASDNTLLENAIVNDQVKIVKKIARVGYNAEEDQQANYYLRLAIDSDADDVAMELAKTIVDPNKAFVGDEKNSEYLDKYSHVSKNSKGTPGGNIITYLTNNDGCNEVFDYLLKQNINANTPDAKGNYPIQKALKNKHFKKADRLLQEKIDLTFGATHGGNVLHWLVQNEIAVDYIDDFVAKGVDINGLDKRNHTPLSMAVSSSKNNYVSTLIKHGADANMLVGDKISPLMSAIYKNSSLVSDLLKHCSNPNVQGRNGWTLLHFAAKENKPTIINELLAKGANPMIKDKWGQTPYRIARDADFAKVSKILRKNMSIVGRIKSSRAFIDYTVKPD